MIKRLRMIIIPLVALLAINLAGALNDTDGDGISDADEINGTLGYKTDPNKIDHDEDGLTDLQEYSYGCDPTCNSTDGDPYLDSEDKDPLVAAVPEIVIRITPEVKLDLKKKRSAISMKSFRHPKCLSYGVACLFFACIFCTQLTTFCIFFLTFSKENWFNIILSLLTSAISTNCSTL